MISLIMKIKISLTLFLLMLVAMSGQAQWQKNALYLGGDLSMLPYCEQQGKIYLDDNGQPVGDLLRWLKEKRNFNSIRVRLFVDPSHAPEEQREWGAIQDLDYVKALGKRIKDLGMSFMLDFHYSDTWADPSQQIIPLDWKSLTNEELYETIYNYTKQTLQELTAAGAKPDLIQIGNEISLGMLRGDNWEYYCVMDSPESTWERLVRLLQQASKACREVCPEAGIIIHTEKVNEIDYLQFFYEKMRDVDYDIIGTSYYREWHGDIAGLDRALTMLEQKFSDKVIMDVETNSCQWADEKENYEFTKSELGQNDFTRAVIETLWQHPHVTGLYWWQPEFSIVSLWDQETGRPLLALSTLMTFLNKNSEGHAPDVTFQYLKNPLFSFNLSGWTNTGGTAFWRENTWEMINNYCDFEWTGQPIVDQEVVQFPELPVGKYRLSASCASDGDSRGLYLVAGDSKQEMPGTGTPVTYSLTFSVSAAGPVKLGFKVQDTTASWANLDNFRLERMDATAISDISYKPKEMQGIYNLTGQRLNKPKKGINIIGGRKVIVK